ncbi:MAG: O-antigen ligase family protein [Winogradskyella sp.]|uniref:O-antigen ligase family protein n=1 Tax=Winogradskyella sp. TaxID=1883156 RepID=UPI0025F348A8|nr:O-antigen ligase family protein [Winogradskyella sp.]NRB59544.1 O-antigen ligase family protein [Winogradskyella sp.]
MNALKRIDINSHAFLAYPLGLCLSTLLLSYFLSSLFVGAFIILSVRHAVINKTLKKSIKIADKRLFLPILFYLFCVLSLFWSVDSAQTLKGLGRLLVLILVPVGFIFVARFDSKAYLKVLKIFTISNFLIGIFFLITAAIKYIDSNEINVFTYHELVSPLELNAIYVSLFYVIGVLLLICKENKSKFDKVQIGFFSGLLLLLSSKTLIFGYIICLGLLFVRNFKRFNKQTIFISLIVIISTMIIGTIVLSNRIEEETKTRIDQVFEKDIFGKAYYWTGTSIRLLQLRILKEQLEEDAIFFKGFGLFASKENIKKRHEAFNTYPGFHSYNYHNQYAQTVAELGIIGLLILFLMIFALLSKGIKSANFAIITFGLIMTLIFCTEAVLWRQRGLFLFVIFYCIFIGFQAFNAKKHI